MLVMGVPRVLCGPRLATDGIMRTLRVHLTTSLGARPRLTALPGLPGLPGLTALTVAAIVLAASTTRAAGPGTTSNPTAKLDKAVKSLLEAGRDGSVPV